MQPGVRMRRRPAVRRTKSDADRIEQITSLKTDRRAAHVIELDLDVRPWLAGTVVSAVQVQMLDDGWTVVTSDGSISAHFENTIAITASGPQILTAR